MANRNAEQAWETFKISSISDGDKVNFQVNNGQYITVEGEKVVANRNSLSSRETFGLKKISGSSAPRLDDGDRISLQANNGKYVVAERGGGEYVYANRDAASSWEFFTINLIWKSRAVYLQANNGQYFVAEGGGNNGVLANRDTPQDWETFRVINMSNPSSSEISDGDEVSFIVHNGRFIVAEDGGGGSVGADRKSPSSWEKFVIQKTGGSGQNQIRNRDKITLQANNGKYVVAERGGGESVLANRDAASSWENFIIYFP
jgi:hypothetical protein